MHPEQDFGQLTQYLLFHWRTGTYFLDNMLPYVKREMWRALQRPLANQFEEEHYLWVVLQETREDSPFESTILWVSPEVWSLPAV